jgi:prevent-host-death family protein
MTEPREVGLREARAVLGDIARAAADEGQVTYLTSHGFRVAAVVPAADATARICGHGHGGWKCNIQAGHDGRHTAAYNGHILDSWEQQR